MKKLVLLISIFMVLTIFAAGALACEKPDCTHNTANAEATAVGVGIGGQGGQGGKATATGGNATISNSGNSSIEGSGNSKNTIMIEDKREFPDQAPPIFQQFPTTYGEIYLKTYLQKKEKELLNSMLGSIPPDSESLSIETIKKNSINKLNLNPNRILNELPLLGSLAKGNKGINNFKYQIEFNEDDVPEGPAKEMRFIKKKENGKLFQIVNRDDLQVNNWIIGAEIVINGIPGVWLSQLKWTAYSLLMKKTGYKYGAVVGVYRSNASESFGKNMQAGGTGNWLTNPELAAYNAFLGSGHGSSMSWQDQKYDLVVAALRPVHENATVMVIEPPPTPASPQVSVPPPPPPKQEVEVKIKIETPPPPPSPVQAPLTPAPVPTPPTLAPAPAPAPKLLELPKFWSMFFPLNCAEIMDFVSGRVMFDNLAHVQENILQAKKLIPLFHEYPTLRILVIGGNSPPGPEGTFETKTKEGKQFDNNTLYNRGGLGPLRSDNALASILNAIGKEWESRFIVTSIGWNQNSKFLFNLEKVKGQLTKKELKELEWTLQQRVDIIPAFYDRLGGTYVLPSGEAISIQK